MNVYRFFHKFKMAPKFFFDKINYYTKWQLMVISKTWVLNPISLSIRPWIWKKAGVQIKGTIKIGYDVYFDVGYSNLIIIEDGVWIASKVLLLCHKRIISDYSIGDDYNELPYKSGEILLKKGCCVGMGSIIMPGVSIGEGSIIGAGSIVTKDVPNWCIATGNPAKVIRYLRKRVNISDSDAKYKI